MTEAIPPGRLTVPTAILETASTGDMALDSASRQRSRLTLGSVRADPRFLAEGMSGAYQADVANVSTRRGDSWLNRIPLTAKLP